MIEVSLYQLVITLSISCQCYWSLFVSLYSTFSIDASCLIIIKVNGALRHVMLRPLLSHLLMLTLTPDVSAILPVNSLLTDFCSKWLSYSRIPLSTCTHKHNIPLYTQRYTCTGALSSTYHQTVFIIITCSSFFLRRICQSFCLCCSFRPSFGKSAISRQL